MSITVQERNATLGALVREVENEKTTIANLELSRDKAVSRDDEKNARWCEKELEKHIGILEKTQGCLLELSNDAQPRARRGRPPKTHNASKR